MSASEEEMEIPVPNVSGSILSKVLEYHKKHVELAGNDEAIKAFDTDFMKIDLETLFDLILAANYLNFQSLLDLTCQRVADMMKGKTPEEIRKTFNIESCREGKKKKVILVSSDNQEFEIEEEVAMQMLKIKRIIEEGRAAAHEINLPNVSGTVLSKVLEYANKQLQL